jgi:hypothetical protein
MSLLKYFSRTGHFQETTKARQQQEEATSTAVDASSAGVCVCVVCVFVLFCIVFCWFVVVPKRKPHAN